MEHIEEDFDLFAHPHLEKLKALNERQEEIFDAVIKYRGPRVAAFKLGLRKNDVLYVLETTVAHEANQRWDDAVRKHRREYESR